MTKIISIKNNRKEPGPKTIWEHIGITGKSNLFDNIKKYLKSLALFVIIGYLIGTILDIMLKTNYYGAIMAIGMLLFWIFKAFGKDLMPPKKEKRCQ